MANVLQSQSWYRVAKLRPKLRRHAVFHRHRYRDELWYLLQDPVSNKVHRFTPSSRLIIACMDGERTVDELWNIACEKFSDEAPTQEEVIQLLGQLHTFDLLQSDVSPDATEAFARGEKQQKSHRKKHYINPLSIRIPLWDPDKFLNKLTPLISLLWSRWGALLWVIVVLPAVFMLPSEWGALSNNFADQVLALDNLLLVWLSFPFIKALHELGHGAAIKAGGGEVHDMGIMLLVLMPVPYVEASVSSTFKSKYARAGVGAAGMIVELFIAALAFYGWLIVEPGLVSALLFNTMMIAGFTTLIFNGNPLLRYDAYYILSDLIEIPNLATRASRYWFYLIQRYLLGADPEPPRATRGEKAWFLFYGPTSTAYRIFVTLAIAFFVATQYLVIGVVLALWALILMILVPLFKGLKFIFFGSEMHANRLQAATVTLLFVFGFAGYFSAVPSKFRSTAQGVIWFADESMVRATASGFLETYVAEPGQTVKKGQALIELKDPELLAQLQVTKAIVRELKAMYGAEFTLNTARAQILKEKLDSEYASLARAQQRAEGLTVYASTDGTFIVPNAVNTKGRFYQQGDLLGYVVKSEDRPLARVSVPNSQIDVIRQLTQDIVIRHVHQPEVITHGRIARFNPAGSERLPSKVLASSGGGDISVDPRDPKGTKTLERMFQFDIELEDQPAKLFWGERVYVRFEHQAEPLAFQWYRGLRRLFLSHFSI